MENKNIIIFSSIDWTTHRQLHHELVENLIKDGNRILFIENVETELLKKILPFLTTIGEE